MRWSSRFAAQPSAEEVVALLRSVHEITAETQGEPINESIVSSSIVFAGLGDPNLSGCFSAANLRGPLSASCPELPDDVCLSNGSLLVTSCRSIKLDSRCLRQQPPLGCCAKNDSNVYRPVSRA